MREKNLIRIYLLSIINLLLLLSSSCKKDEAKQDQEKMPVLITSLVSRITDTSALCGGNITSDGGSIITARGICWNPVSSPTISNSKTIESADTGSYKSIIAGLMPNTKYYVRAYATNAAGTKYGNEWSFTTPESITDIDGNVYHTVLIGTQVWMRENLKTTKYSDGMDIPPVTNSSAPGYCWYNNDKLSYSYNFGALYNWYTVNTGKLAPKGWHIPTDAEWEILTEFLGGYMVAGGKLKEIDTILWLSPNEAASNESGFSGLPGGYRLSTGIYLDMGSDCIWWSTTENSSTTAFNRPIGYNYASAYRHITNKTVSLSVRCVKD